jgi:SAM-dependent methyltransferase
VTTFAIPADAYDAFMGRYSRRLAGALADFAGVGGDTRVVDIGCGPGALSEELVRRLGAGRVAAAEPAEAFVAACRRRCPGVDVRLAPAEALPWPDATFDAALAQLVLTFMRDAPAGVREMRRVVRPGGGVAACSWDLRGGMTMLRTFWEAARRVRDDPPDESGMRWNTPDELRELWSLAGLQDVVVEAIESEAEYADFDDFWKPFRTGVGPAGAYCARLDEPTRERVREECRRLLGDPTGPFTLSARAWAVRGVRPLDDA